MLRYTRIVFLAFFLLAGVTPAHANFPTPQQMLWRYFASINLRDYAAAYRLWVTPRQSFGNFAAGFADTVRVLPYFGDVRQVSLDRDDLAQVPAVLLGYHVDGNIVSYYGCFTTIYRQDFRISASDFRLLPAVPDATTIAQYLQIACPVSSPPVVFSTQPTDKGRELLNYYYDLINQRDYNTAYQMWLSPAPGPKPNGRPDIDYRLPYNTFVNGYGDTAYVFAYSGKYVEAGAAAGKPYLNGYLPAVLIGLHTDGTAVAYSGCYVFGWLPSGSLGIVSGSFTPLPMFPTGDLWPQFLNLDCTRIGLLL